MSPFSLTSFTNPAGRMLDRFWRCDSGVNAIEFAFVMPILVAILLVTIQVAIILMAQSYLEVVAENAMRLVVTNQAQTAGMSQSDFQKAICANLTGVFTCGNLIVSLQTAPTCSSTQLTQCQASMASSAPTYDDTGKLKTALPYQLSALTQGTIGMLMIEYQWPVIGGPLGLHFGTLGNGAFLLVATQVFQVEPNT